MNPVEALSLVMVLCVAMFAGAAAVTWLVLSVADVIWRHRPTREADEPP